MTPTEARKSINRILQALDDIPSKPDWTDNDEAMLVWEALEELRSTAATLARAHSHALAKRLPRDYTHPSIGPVHTETESSIKWDGNAVLTSLSESVVPVDTQTGEILGRPVLAVRTDILRKAIPACGPNQTSSKWNKGGLLAAGIDPAMYSHTDYGAKLLKRGPRYNRGQSAHPESTMEDSTATAPPADER